MSTYCFGGGGGGEDGRAGSREVNFLTGRILAHELVGEGESALSGLTGSQGA